MLGYWINQNKNQIHFFHRDNQVFCSIYCTVSPFPSDLLCQLYCILRFHIFMWFHIYIWFWFLKSWSVSWPFTNSILSLFHISGTVINLYIYQEKSHLFLPLLFFELDIKIIMSNDHFPEWSMLMKPRLCYHNCKKDKQLQDHNFYIQKHLPTGCLLSYSVEEGVT